MSSNQSFPTPIRVLIVDDSATVRRFLTRILSAKKNIVVVGEAPDAFEARKKVKELNPDVLTLDVEMPKMNGLTFLRNLMRFDPLPVIMVSTLTKKGTKVALNALEYGAVDVILKPDTRNPESINEFSQELIDKIKLAFSIKEQLSVKKIKPADTSNTQKSFLLSTQQKKQIEIIAIGSSTGGVEAVRKILENQKNDIPPILITQHILKQFSQSFADRLDQLCKLKISQARRGLTLEKGCVYIAPGDEHLIVKRKADGKLFCTTTNEPKINGHRPAVDVLFHSVSKEVGKNALGILLTGMGKDGAEGLLQMKQHGAITIAQDKFSSVVWGMPKAAIDLGAANYELSLPKIEEALNQFSTALSTQDFNEAANG